MDPKKPLQPPSSSSSSSSSSQPIPKAPTSSSTRNATLPVMTPDDSDSYLIATPNYSFATRSSFPIRRPRTTSSPTNTTITTNFESPLSVNRRSHKSSASTLSDWVESYNRSVQFSSSWGSNAASSTIGYLPIANDSNLENDINTNNNDTNNEDAEEPLATPLSGNPYVQLARKASSTSTLFNAPEFLSDNETKEFEQGYLYGYEDNTSDSDINIEESSSDEDLEELLDHHRGSGKKSSLAQATFNSINVLVGVGILSLPYAFKLTGWLLGVILLFFFCILTRHTARLLIQCMKTDSSCVTYSDIGERAFGSRGRLFISFLFFCELFAAAVALFILISDSVISIYPAFDPLIVKLVAFCIVTPTTWPRSLSVLSYGSILGIFTIFNLIVIIYYNGLSNKDSTPGSLWLPAEGVTMFPTDASSWWRLPTCFGLLMAPFSGHAILPSIYRDMAKPVQFPKMLNTTYIITMFFYLSLAIAGYFMFGTSTLEEITQNLPLIPTYSKTLTLATIYLIIINPFTKYALTIVPVSITLEMMLMQSRSCALSPSFIRISLRTLVSVLTLMIAIVFPGFHRVMALLGSLGSLTVSVVLPLAFYLKLFWTEISGIRKCVDVALLIVSSVMAVMGTVWSFLP